MIVSLHAVLFVISGVGILWLIRPRNRRPLPPGPPADPLIGHARILPAEHLEEAFYQWSKIYGEVLHIRIPGRNYIVLNSLKAANDLLDKRSAIYSDRAKLIIYELMDWFPIVAMVRYGKRFQKHRRMLHEYLNQKRCEEYRALQRSNSRKLVFYLIDQPQNWFENLERFTSSLIIRVAYGHDVAQGGDHYIDVLQKAGKALTEFGPPGGTVVDFLPFLQYLPRWFPGTYYVHQAISFRPIVHELFSFPYEQVKKQLDNGTAKPSYLSHQLSQFRPEEFNDPEHIKDVQGSAAVFHIAGQDTTHATLIFFFYAMTVYPEWQRRAQEEIDRVIGRERLPDFDDRNSLPYVDAILYETYRWKSAVPLGIPHRCMEDDIYNGMFIPKGSIVIANARAILGDENVYSKPDEFNPSRYLPKPIGNGEPYPTAQFGFGRRICPGRHFADESLWIKIASILATLTIGKAVDEKGSEIYPELDLVTGVTSHPKSFPCSIKPRDKAAKMLARSAQLWQD